MQTKKKPANLGDSAGNTKLLKPKHTKQAVPSTSTMAQVYGLLSFLLSDPAHSINRYEAERAFAIAHLARRIKDLKEAGCRFVWADETASDPHGVEHVRIRRYSLTFAPAALQRAARAAGDVANQNMRGPK